MKFQINKDRISLTITPHVETIIVTLDPGTGGRAISLTREEARKMWADLGEMLGRFVHDA